MLFNSMWPNFLYCLAREEPQGSLVPYNITYLPYH
jgi:hypothetical protein